MENSNKNNNNYKSNKPSKDNRPSFPKRAVITGGMPYGNKQLHFGHVGGVFVFADTYAAGTTVISSGQEFASYASSSSIEKCDV